MLTIFTLKERSRGQLGTACILQVGTLVEEGGSSACMQALDAAAPNAAPAKKAEVDCSGEADDMTCAICLEHIPVEDLCVVKSCNHIYCGVLTATLAASDSCSASCIYPEQKCLQAARPGHDVGAENSTFR